MESGWRGDDFALVSTTAQTRKYSGDGCIVSCEKNKNGAPKDAPFLCIRST